MKTFSRTSLILFCTMLGACTLPNGLEVDSNADMQRSSVNEVTYTTITADQVLDVVRDQNAELIDVRTPEEIAAGSIVGTEIFADINSPTFFDTISLLPKDAPYIVYCASGRRSTKASMIMAEEGFTQIYNLDGGYQAWEQYATDTPELVESPVLQNALDTALHDELKAEATYEGIIAQFGQVKPFTNIQRAEQKHSAALLALYEQYDLVVPVFNDISVEIPDTLANACTLGVEAEVENIVMYDDLLEQVAEYSDVVTVFTNLQRASEQNHMPAFERCATRL